MEQSSALDWVGAGAAILTTSAFLPQALLTVRTRDVSGISLGMYSLFTLGVGLWLIYGVLLGQWPIIVANALTLALAAMILSTKLLVDRQQRLQRISDLTQTTPANHPPR